MSDSTIDTGHASDAEASEGRLGRILYRLAIFVLFGVACYSTFEGLKALSGFAAVALVLTGLFQGALLGSAIFLGRDLANYASGRKGARISAGGRGVRYGLTILIYCLCLVLCVFFAFTFWHRLLLDRGTGLEITLPKITELASDFVAGQLTGGVAMARREEPRAVAKKSPVSTWTTAVRQINTEASTDAIAKTLAESVYQGEKRRAEERSDLRRRATDSINRDNEVVRVQTQRVTNSSREKETSERNLSETKARIEALRAARTEEAGPPAPNPPTTLPANGNAFRLTRSAACQPERSSGVGSCFTAIETAIQQTEQRVTQLQPLISTAERVIREANELLATARERLATSQKRLEDNPALPIPDGPVIISGKARFDLTEGHLESFSREPTSSAFMTVVQDCTASAEALTVAGKQANSASCRSNEVEAEAAAFTDYVARYDTYMAACGERKPVEKAEVIERETRAALRGINDQASQQRRVDEALRKTFAEIVGECVAKARAIGGDVAISAGKVEDSARTFVSGNILDRDPQDRAFDAIASLFRLRGGLPVAGAAFLAVLQETLILCFAFLLHLADHDRRPAAPVAAPSALRTRLDWTPDPDNDPPRVLAAKFLYTELEMASDGGGRLARDYAAGEPEKVSVNADAIVKWLARNGHAHEERNGAWVVTREGVGDIEAIVIEHHDSVVSGSASKPPSPGAARSDAMSAGSFNVASSAQGRRASSTSPEGGTPSSERSKQPSAQGAVADPASHRPGASRPAEAAPLPAQRRQGRQRDASYAFRRDRD